MSKKDMEFEGFLRGLETAQNCPRSGEILTEIAGSLAVIADAITAKKDGDEE